MIDLADYGRCCIVFREPHLARMDDGGVIPAGKDAADLRVRKARDTLNELLLAKQDHDDSTGRHDVACPRLPNHHMRANLQRIGHCMDYPASGRARVGRRKPRIDPLALLSRKASGHRFRRRVGGLRIDRPLLGLGCGHQPGRAEVVYVVGLGVGHVAARGLRAFDLGAHLFDGAERRCICQTVIADAVGTDFRRAADVACETPRKGGGLLLSSDTHSPSLSR